MEFDVEMPSFSVVGTSLTNYNSLLKSNMMLAMLDIEQSMVTDTQLNMNWVNPTGDLEDSIYTDSSVPDAFTAIIGSELPYAHRRNDGFDGMDSLGRVYDDLGAYFLDDALASNVNYIQLTVNEAVYDAWASAGGA